MIEFLDRPVAFHRAFVRLGAGVTGALLLSQAIYWSKRTQCENGWFYKTQQEWTEETGMTRRELDTARKKLRENGILEEKKQGVPCRIFYRINETNLIAQLQQTSLHESAKQGCTNAPSRAAQIRQPITENTHRLPETTKHIDHEPDHSGDQHSKLIDECFDRFWKIYPNSFAKKRAKEKFKSALKNYSGTPEEFTAMLCDDVSKRIHLNQFGFTKLHAQTYLNQERWNDPYETNQSGSAQTSAKPNRYERLKETMLRRYGHTATPDGGEGDSVQPAGLGADQVHGGVRGEVATRGTTIDLDTGDFYHVEE